MEFINSTLSGEGDWSEFLEESAEIIQGTRKFVTFIRSWLVVALFLFCICEKIRMDPIGKRGKKQEIPEASWFGFKIPFVDALYTPFKLRNEGVKVFEQLAAKYGHIYELPFAKIKTVVVSDAEVIKKILMSNNMSHMNKPRYLYDKVFENILNQGLFMIENEAWVHHRTITNRTFNYAHLKLYLKSMNNHANALISKLLSEKSSADMMDFKQVKWLIDFHALGMVAETLWGPGASSDDANQSAHENIHRAKEIVMYRFMHPEFFIETLWKLHPKKWELDKLWAKFIHSLHEIVEKHKINAKVQDESTTGEKPVRYMVEDMLASGMTDNEIYSEMATFLVAGFETTGLTLTLMLFHLALNPAVQSECQKEIDTVIDEKENFSGDGDSNFNLTMEDLSKLKYVDRCLLETLRITTAVPIFSRRLDEPLRINDNLELQAGQNILMLPWVLHRDSKHFPNPMQFDPDRFRPEIVKNRYPYAYVPFAGGSRNCVGKKFAMMEVKVLLVYILRNFNVTTEDSLEDLKFMVEASLRPERDIRMKLAKRK